MSNNIKSMAENHASLGTESRGLQIVGAAAPAWVAHSHEVAPECKRAMARQAVSEVRFADKVQLASGASLDCLMDEIIALQVRDRKALDLIVFTTNLQVFAKGRDARNLDSNLFSTMQIVLTGGTLQPSLDSLIGEFAAKGVSNELMHPRLVFFGAAGLTFRDKQLRITYHFQDEISTQVAYATRRTEHRILLCDHTKLGTSSGFEADLSAAALLRNAEKCTIFSTCPTDDPEALSRIQEEEEAFDALIRSMVDDPQYAKKDFVFQLVSLDGKTHKQHSLRALRAAKAAR